MRHALAAAIGVLVTLSSFAQQELRVLPESLDGVPPTGMMKEYLLGHIAACWEQWKTEYEGCTTPDSIAAYQQRLHDEFIAAIGGLPERTPLNAQQVGVIERDGYRVEKILFESRPRFYVSAALFVPDASRHAPPYPGVLVPCGHAKPAKAHIEYQSVGALLALNGMAALVYDPIDQGERMQIVKPDGSYDSWGTNSHTLIGAPSILLGRNTAAFEIWDGMRGIDYLQSRPEIDPERIGLTGNSGGGTQSSYLMALDARVKAAAVSCYLHYQAVQLRKAPGDAEQNIFNQMLIPLDHPDFIMMKAPRPVLICAATQDFFDINATWETFRLAKRFYTRMGCPERVDLLENDAKHNYDKTQREGVARWMSRWLLSKDQVIVEPELNLIDEKEMWCTPGGQVMLLEGARSTYDLNQDYEIELAARRASLWATKDKPALLEQIRQQAGIRHPADLPEPEVVRIEGAPEGVQKLILKPEKGIWLPALWFGADVAKTDVILFVSEKGKQDGEPLAKDGVSVFAVDVRGVGETAPPGESYKGEGLGDDWVDYFRAYVLGRSYVGMRAEDIIVCARWLKSQGKAVRLVAAGNVGVPALHAAALEPDLFESVKLSGALDSWRNVIGAVPPGNQLINTVHGALTFYDLPELAATLGNKLTVENPVDAQGVLLREAQWKPWTPERKPEYTVKRAAERPGLDGNWDSPAWNAANVLQIDNFLAIPAFKPEARARVLYDHDGLYLIFRVNDKFVRSVATEYRGKVWEDACVEFFVQPKAERGYFNFEVNCGGTMLLSYHENPDWTGPTGQDGAVPWELAQAVTIYHSMPRTVEPEISDETEWRIEYFIPFRILETYAGPLGSLPGQTWRANFYKCAETNSNPHWAAWSSVALGHSFHSPRNFGILRFE